MTTTTLTATTAESFVDSLGINTHIDFDNYGYQNLSTVESAIEYLGVTNIRDCANSTSDISAWAQVAAATGAKFDDYMTEGSVSAMEYDLTLVPQLAAEGILESVEGGNEEDDSYAASEGNNIATAAQFQQQVYAMGQQYGLAVINMSFGAGWTAANNWEGDYPNVGNLSAYTTYANAHTYPNVGQNPDYSIETLNADAKLAASSRPVITTEIGWDASTFTNETQIAQYVVQAALDGIKDGDVKMYYYALFNDSSGDFGLMNQNGTPTLAGTALHDLTTLMADTGANASSFTPGSLTFNMSGNESTDNTLLFQKSNGSDWLAVWDETAGTHSVTISLTSAASQIVVYDPVTGTTAIQSESNASSVTVSLGNDPLLIEIVPSGSSAATTSSSSSSGSTSSSSTSSSSSSASTTTTTTTTTASSNDLAVTVPASESVATGSTTAISGVSVSDAWAATAGGTMALNVWDSSGTLSINGETIAAGGGPVANGMFSGTLAQINADLATLTYTAGASGGSDTITVDVWNQAGVEVKKTITVNVSGSSSSTSSSSTSGSSTSSSSTSSTSGSGSTSASSSTSSSTATSNDLSVTGPASESVAAGATAAISGAAISDAWAANHAGSMALTVTDLHGTLTIDGETVAAGSTTTLIGTLAQLNTDLAGLTYTAPSGGGADTITLGVWNQAGVEATDTIAITTGSSSGSTTTSSSSTASGGGSSTASSGGTSTSTTTTTPANSVTIAASDADPVENVSNTAITAVSGDHMLFIGGTGNTVTLTGGTETVQAFLGNNNITTGTGNDTIAISGSNNVVNAGSGNNTIEDSGSNNTIVLGGAGSDDTIYGYVLQNGDTLDLRSALATTTWNGTEGTLGNYLSVGSSGNNATVLLQPNGSGTGGSVIATLQGAGSVTLSTLLQHALT